MVAQRVQLEAKTASKYYLIAEYRSLLMRQFKEMLHLGTPANVQYVLVQDQANNLPVHELQMQQMALNAAICAAFATATIVPRKKTFLMTNSLMMIFMMMRRKPEEED